jgi:hypothetical protein
MKTQNSSRSPYVWLFAAIGLMLMPLVAVSADYQSTVLGDHPLAYYPINSDVDPTGTTATDLSGNGNSGTYNGTDPEFNTVPGPSSFLPNALYFDGFTSFVDLSTGANPTMLNFGGPITMEAWVQPVDPGQSLGYILAKGYDNDNNGNELTLRLNGNQYQGGAYNYSVGQKGAGGGTPTTDWAYVVSTFDGTNWNMYVNGQLVAQSADSVGAINWPAPWAIGDGTVSGNTRFFNGNICQVALYTNALTAAQVYAHYFAGEYGTTPDDSVPIIITQPTPQVSFVGGGATFNVAVLSELPVTNQWYKGSTPIGGATNLTLVLTNVQPADAVNYSVVIGNSNGTTNSLSASLTLSLPVPTVYESKILNDQPIAFCPLEPSVDTTTTAYDWSGNGNNGIYNASSSYNSGNGPAPYIGNSANFNGSLSATLGGQNVGLLNFGGQITLEAWVQPANVTGNLQNILAKGYDSSTYNETVLRQDSGTFTGNGGSGGTAQAGTWAYVVSANDGTNWNLYVNGILVKQSGSTSGAQNFSDPWAIGSGSSGGANRFLTGNLSQVALYNYGLSPAQVAAHYLVAESGATNVRPVIATQPASQNGFVGGTTIFSVAAVSLSPVTNQWFWNGNPLNGQTNATLTLNNVSLVSAGNYSVVVGNIYGITNSAVAILSVSVPNNLIWSAINNSGVWDTGISANWSNLTTSAQTVFNTGDAVTFDDTANVPTTVTLGGTVQPSLVTVDSSVNNFSIVRAGDGSGVMNGSGSLVKKGTSTLTVNTGGTLTGTATIAGGVVYAGNNSFANLSGITITNNSTMDIGGGSFNNAEPVTISDSGFNGQGAIINSYGNYPTAAFQITLAGDATISGSPQRWDLVSGSVTGAHTLTISGNGSYSMEWNSVTIGVNVANIIFTNGEFGMKYLDNAFQNPATVVTVASNAKFDFWNGGFNGSLYLMPGVQVNIFTGQALTIASGATLSGVGSTINGDLTVGAGAIISPSTDAAIGSISVSGNITLNGMTVLRLNGSGINDAIVSSNSITYGGTLTLTNISNSPLAAGNSFQLFITTNATGSFASITPATPGTGLVWDLSQLSNGVIGVKAGTTGPVIGNPTVSGGKLVFSGTGGTPSGSYSVLTTTNIATPVANWTALMTNSFDASGNFSVTNAIAPGTPKQFYTIKQLP